MPCDDRGLPFLFHARSADYQYVTTQGVITYRVTDPVKLAERVDFTVDPRKGAFLQTPLDQLAQMLTQLAQQFAVDYVARTPVREIQENELANQIELTRRQEALIRQRGANERLQAAERAEAGAIAARGEAERRR
ncbi:MAG: SPFH domain-containing protein, partial [Deferrisomatales bacterium]